MIRKILSKIMGDPNEKQLQKIAPLVTKINHIEEKYQQEITSDEQVKAKTEELKTRHQKGESLDDLLPEAFALVKTACRRLYGREFELTKVYDKDSPEGKHKYAWKMIPFDVQLIGGIVLHGGKIAEMKTGEGKTLVCTLPLFLNALTGNGVFLVTANEYLAERDSEWMGILYNYLGLTVGVVLNGLSRDEKHAAYRCDITYGTNNEFGFDYLRDNMMQNTDNIVQRQLNYAIIDEVDSILIDEARTPLIISAPAEESTEKYQRYARLVNQLTSAVHYEIDEKQRTAVLTEEGIAEMERLLGVENIYTDAGFGEVHHLEQALKANAIFKRDIDYVIKDDEILIVDEFTGRLMPGRRYSDGLHQAIEAKENVEVKRESRTLATVTFQNYFRLFKKLAGMTGTAKTEEEEFYQIYGLETIVIPTNQNVIRDDQPDLVYKNTRGKYQAIAKKVKEAHLKGQAILIGTVSIEKSEHLSRELVKENIPHSVLNAKFHEKEAEIVAKAGLSGAVTIATNMAGRGTDIKLDPEVKTAGGLLVIGTERHESRRIDNQLRGRSGRQGDPGESQFFLSMEDELMRLFSGDRVLRMMEVFNFPEDMPIQNKIINNSIESAQKRVEGRNFDIRKHLVEYDDVMNKHREIIYSRRRKILFNEEIKNEILLMIEKEAERLAQLAYSSENKNFEFSEIIEYLSTLHRQAKTEINLKELENLLDLETVIGYLKTYLFEIYNNKEAQLRDTNVLRQLEKNVYLSVIDSLWMEHIDNMQHLRETVSLRGYGQRDPLLEYKEQSYLMFKQLMGSIQTNSIATLYRINLAEHLPSHLLKLQENTPARLLTNENSIKEQHTGASWVVSHPPEAVAEQNVTVINPDHSTKTVSRACATLGRNDICPECGVKAKRCPKA